MAVLGGALARTHRLDAFGFVTLAILSGMGGGMIRDALLGQGPVAALTDGAYLLTALIAAAVIYLVRIEGRWWDRTWPVIDALALGCWAVVGTQKALAAGLGWLPALFLGTLTAVGGGAVRDVILNKVPSILGGNTLYASCAILASGVVIAFGVLDLPTLGSLVGLVVGATVCLVARARGWRLPEGYEPSLTRAGAHTLELGRRLRGSARLPLRVVRRMEHDGPPDPSRH
ncbi:trimeric intracellular cation channel family protein [Ruania sp. N2-46]|uniref:Trimeric intracellular cation channel family protein n=2 Tax=Occultella gossypii TaxID=2800820 RepID=A0ABS7S9C7_9MICO|nr:trimeric intracellular cation channel family protein [Occultella gossypii]